MILVDTSIWVDHLRTGDEALAGLLNAGRVLTHPHIIGELALGDLKQRQVILHLLRNLPRATVATDDEVLGFIDAHAIFGVGVGYVDAHLLAAVRLTPDAALWTRDKRLFAAARDLGLAAPHGR